MNDKQWNTLDELMKHYTTFSIEEPIDRSVIVAINKRLKYVIAENGEVSKKEMKEQ